MKTLFPLLSQVAASSLLALGLFATISPVQAQSRNLYDWAWVSRLGPTALPGQGAPLLPPAIDGQPEHIAADGASNVVITGLYDPDVIFDNPTAPYQTGLGPRGRRNGYLAKYTPSGALAWSLNIASDADMAMNDVATDGLGNIYALGNYTQQLRIGGAVVTLTSNTRASFIAKFSPTGALLWVNNVEPDAPVTNTIGLKRLATDAAGNCVVQGEFLSRIVFNGVVYDGGNSRTHLFMARYSTTGVLVGAFAGYAMTGTTQDRLITGVGLTSTGETYVSGSVTAAATLQFGTLPPITGPTTANAAGFLLKFSAANAPVWALSTTGPARQSSTTASGQSLDGIAVGPQDRCYAVGSLNGSTMALGAQPLNTGNLAGAVGKDIFVARIAPSGVVESLVGGGGTSKVWGFAVGPQGETTISTGGGLDWGAVQLPGAAWPASLLTGVVQLNATGMPQRGWQAGLSFFAPLIAVDGLNRPVLAGTYATAGTFTFGTQQHSSPYAWSTLIARTGTVLLATRQATQVPGLEVYPNPARNVVEVHTAKAEPAATHLLDALGRTVRTQFLSVGQTQVTLTGLAPGFYTLVVQQGATRSYRHLTVEL